MKHVVMILALVGLTACENPTLNIGASISSGGVRVSPSVSGDVGSVGVTVSP